MLQMTDCIRQFGRPVVSPGDAACEPLVVIRQVLALARDLATQRDVRLAYEGPDELPPARIAGVELTQILLNLCINATQAIELAGRPGRAVLTGVASASHVELALTDDGVGMTPEALRKAGTPFYTTRAEGSGLGLAQCYRLVGRADGTLTIRSTEGLGTAVAIRLPRAAASGP